MARTLLAVAVLAVCCFALIAGQGTQLCDNNKAPGQPWNSMLYKNYYDPASKTSKLYFTWNSPVKTSSDGCLNSYRIEYYDSTGKKLGSQILDAKPITNPLSFTLSAAPGRKTTVKIVAVNSLNKKEGPAETVGTVTPAAAPVTAAPAGH